jgi:pyruvate/2-oxoglutarate dehydrogenase complex dihydrolipoamide dehydrogenase (E3) component
MSMERYDAIVIGGGQAGGPLVHKLAGHGWKVAFIEREHLGGSCINYGCTPTKTMIASAKVAQQARRSAEYGVHTGDISVNMAAVVRRKNEIVIPRRESQEKAARENENITLIYGEASFSGPHQITVGGHELESDKIFINTGTRAEIPAVDGIQRVDILTNKTIIDLDHVPEHLVVLGANYVGLEFGQMFRRFGSQVTILDVHERIASREDHDISQALQEALAAEGIRFLLETQASQVERDASGRLRLWYRNGSDATEEVIEGSHLLAAVGRVPNTDALHLERAGIRQKEDGFVWVDEYLETNVPGVYAMGDVKGGPMFTHLSYNDYQIVYHNLFHENKMTWRDRIVPYTLYTDPELGRVGLTEQQAREQGMHIRVGKISMDKVARAVERGETRGLMKIVIDARTEQIVGASILSAEGGELVQTLMALMLAKAPWTVLKEAVFIHPTLTEGFYSLMDSVKDQD